MQLNDGDVARWHNMNASQPILDAAPTSDLGAMYLATWQVAVCYGGERPPSVPVEIYPFTQGGMLLHVQSGSSGCARDLVEPGWWRAKPGLAPMLAQYGVPLNDPAALSGAATVEPPASPPDPYAVAVVILAALLGVVAVSRRQLVRDGDSPDLSHR